MYMKTTTKKNIFKIGSVYNIRRIFIMMRSSLQHMSGYILVIEI